MKFFTFDSHFKIYFYLFTLAFLIRVLFCSQGMFMAGDSAQYLDIAKNLSESGSFAVTLPDGSVHLTAFRPFLYPFMLSVLGNNFILIGLMQSLMGAATVVLTYDIGRKINRAVGIIAALIMCFAPSTIGLTAAILNETLFTFTTVLGCHLWSRENWKLSGTAFGLAALTKPAIFPFLLALPVAAFIFQRAKIKNYALLIGVAVFVSSFWIIRNSVLLERFTLTQSSGYGINLFSGTLETKLYNDSIGQQAVAISMAQIDSSLSESESDAALVRVAAERIKANPAQWLRVRAKQYPRLFLDSGEYALRTRNKLFNEAWANNDLLVVGFKVLCIIGSAAFTLLSLIGFYNLRHRLGDYLYIWLFPAVLAAVLLPMWIEPRYLIPASPFLAILAATATVNLLGRLFKERRDLRLKFKTFFSFAPLFCFASISSAFFY
jgi:hypothetical protein